MDHEKGNTLKVYIKQYLNRYKGCYALVAGIMIFYIFTLYLCGVSAADIRYFAGLEIVFLVVSAVFCGIRYWYRLRTVKRQIRDYMQGMQALSDTEDALEEVYMDALEQLRISGRRKREHTGASSGKWKNIMLCGCIRSKRRSPRCVCFCRGKNKNR